MKHVALLLMFGCAWILWEKIPAGHAVGNVVRPQDDYSRSRWNVVDLFETQDACEADPRLQIIGGDVYVRIEGKIVKAQSLTYMCLIAGQRP